MGFSNEAIGGVDLVRSAIQSPNFVAGVSGWSINKDGSAQFNNVTVTGGSFVVTTSGQGVFVYAGAPALGNLIVSIASAAGVDAFGNAYAEGVQAQNNGIVEVTTADGRFIQLASTAAGAALLLQPPTEAGHTWTRGIVATAYDAPTERPIMQIHSPFDSASGNPEPRAIMDMRGDNNTLGGSRFDFVADYFDFSSTNFPGLTTYQFDAQLRATDPVSGAAEIQHQVGTDGSLYTAPWAPSSPYNPWFRLLPDGDVEFGGAAFNAAAAIGQTIFTLPPSAAGVGYIPAVARTVLCWGRTNNVVCAVTINTTGTVVLTSMSGSATNHTIELDGIRYSTSGL